MYRIVGSMDTQHIHSIRKSEYSKVVALCYSEWQNCILTHLLNNEL